MSAQRYLPFILLFLASLACIAPADLIRATATPSPTLSAASTPTVAQVRAAHSTETPYPTSTPAWCTVTTGLPSGTVNVRSGPGMQYSVVDVAHEGESLLLGAEYISGWQRVTTPRLVDGYFYEKWCK